MSISTRLSIAWDSAPEPAEATDTLILNSPKDKFVDVRPLIKSDLAFPFEWAFAGEAKLLAADGSKLEFSHDFFDSVFIHEWTEAKKRELAGQAAKYPLKEDISKDVGYFEKLPDGTRRETGAMLNSATGKVENYVEMWMSVDPLKSSPDKKVQVSSSSIEPVPCRVFEVKSGGEGRFMRVGNWAQGVFWDKNNLEQPISVVRLFYNGSWSPVLEHGSVDMFPAADASVQVGETVERGTVVWHAVE
ncbi:hypothetical protein OGAPHI_007181 [Ogataea philodendri]|uniref:Protein HRI1 n=1 Tax=Ogataea philodendri TaxID=1378263 RepID=A0A9P8SZX0_9ASCO|nr:uncharacterized protein OGAPHI_007181 [Ogataea philodendri]KAH3659976.1 hypothetical protein OGAPHI_007181 [Ogataea philodendri]